MPDPAERAAVVSRIRVLASGLPWERAMVAPARSATVRPTAGISMPKSVREWKATAAKPKSTPKRPKFVRWDVSISERTRPQRTAPTKAKAKRPPRRPSSAKVSMYWFSACSAVPPRVDESKAGKATQ